MEDGVIEVSTPRAPPSSHAFKTPSSKPISSLTPKLGTLHGVCRDGDVSFGCISVFIITKLNS